LNLGVEGAIEARKEIERSKRKSAGISVGDETLIADALDL
jgi:hypothetical protein